MIQKPFFRKVLSLFRYVISFPILCILFGIASFGYGQYVLKKYFQYLLQENHITVEHLQYRWSFTDLPCLMLKNSVLVLNDHLIVKSDAPLRLYPTDLNKLTICGENVWVFNKQNNTKILQVDRLTINAQVSLNHRVNCPFIEAEQIQIFSPDLPSPLLLPKLYGSFQFQKTKRSLSLETGYDQLGQDNSVILHCVYTKEHNQDTETSVKNNFFIESTHVQLLLTILINNNLVNHEILKQNISTPSSVSYLDDPRVQQLKLSWYAES